MALELERFLGDLLDRNQVACEDRPFLEAVQGVIRAYLEKRTVNAGEGINRQEEVIREGLDLSKVPYDVDAEDPDTIVSFVTRLDIPYRAKNSLVRHVARLQFNQGGYMRVRNIRDLYGINENGLVRSMWQIGEKGETVIRKNLDSVRLTGEMPLARDKECILLKQRMMNHFHSLRKGREF